MKVIYGTHPIPEKYLLTHGHLGTWKSPQWNEIIAPVLADEKTRIAYN